MNKDMKTIKYDIRCDPCGKFIKFDDILESKATSIFIPDSHVSYEEINYRCFKCTVKHGKPISTQTFIYGNY